MILCPECEHPGAKVYVRLLGNLTGDGDKITLARSSMKANLQDDATAICGDCDHVGTVKTFTSRLKIGFQND